MTILTVRPCGMGSVEFSAPVPLPSNEAFQEWQEVAAESLHYAFADRQVCLITDDERASSLLYLDNLSDTFDEGINGTTYILAFSSMPSLEFFKSVVGSSEFHWDAIWLAPISKEEAWRVSLLMTQK